jgi:hypothetical protein
VAHDKARSPYKRVVVSAPLEAVMTARDTAISDRLGSVELIDQDAHRQSMERHPSL